MSAERNCKTCGHLKKRKGKLYCPIIKQTTSEKNICRHFEAS